jgi:hypothetical protein
VHDLWKRIALALLSGFVTFFAGLPVACGGLMLYSEHVYGDVNTRGPESLLGGMAMAGMLSVLVVALVFWKSSPRR